MVERTPIGSQTRWYFIKIEHMATRAFRKGKQLVPNLGDGTIFYQLRSTLGTRVGYLAFRNGSHLCSPWDEKPFFQLPRSA